jgi:carboxyl-terminal processing protease
LAKFKEINDYTTNLTFNSPLYELPKLKADISLSEKREAWHKNLKKDIYVAEALNVLGDLKMKPQYHLVRN